MELLQNYRARKQLGLTDGNNGNELLDEMIRERLGEGFRNFMIVTPVKTSSNSRSNRASMVKSSEPNSPKQRIRFQSHHDESQNDLLSMIEGLEARIDFLETRNLDISESLGEAEGELLSLRKENADLKTERDHLSGQVQSLKAVVSSESSAEKVLERVSHTDQLDFKLEIYRQQIAVLNDELKKLKNPS